MLLRPGNVEQAVLSFEELLAGDALGGEIEGVEATVADEAEVGAAADGDARVEEGGVFDAVGIEARGAEFEHDDGVV